MTYKRPSPETLAALSEDFQRMLHEAFGCQVLCAMVLIPERTSDYLIMAEGFKDHQDLQNVFENAAEKVDDEDMTDTFSLSRTKQ